MGFESFRVELRGGRTNYPEAKEIVQQHPHVKLDQQSPSMKGSTFYLIDDCRHVLEVELRDAPLRIACRFTLCHPPTVDSMFLDLIRELIPQFGMEVWICDDVPPEDAHPFTFANYAEFSYAALRSIAGRRTEWIAAFGAEQIPATTNEVYERIILPRCQPAAALTERSAGSNCGINSSHDPE